MSARDGETVVRLAREFPVRTGLFTVGPLLIALAQIAIAFVHDVSLLATGSFAAVMVAYAVLVTRYHLAAYRRTSL